MRTTPVFACAALAAAIAGCELFAHADRPPPAASGGNGGAVTISSSSATTGGGGAGGGATGGTGPGIECLYPIDCPGVDTDCLVRTCTAGRCGIGPAPDGTPTSLQIAGDCVRSVCDGKGGQKIVPDDLDVLDDGNGCTKDQCNAGVPSNPAAEAGTACSDGGGVVCDDGGHCVACVSAAQCSGGVCVNNECVSLTCVDDALGPGETDVDCGGPACPPCTAGKKCKVASDCVSSVCTGSPAICFPSSCGDKVKNGTETDVDCGGGDCTAGCGAGQTCVVDMDCKGGLCVSGTCAPTCIDETKNLDETAVDCGGSCAPCADGAACAYGGDCLSQICVGAVCVTPVASCFDSVPDGSETDVDCGGPVCLSCPVGGTCSADADCASRRCVASKCAPRLLLGEARTRGAGGPYDEFLDVYNPLSTPVTLDPTFTVSARSAIGVCSSNTEKVIFTGSGEVIPPRGHLLLGGSSYAQVPLPDVPLGGSGLPDAGSIVIRQGSAVLDALCYAYDAATRTNLASCSVAYVCEGPPADNLPHDNTGNPFSNSDASLERKPGGALGSARDTGDSSLDWKRIAPSRPESSTSPQTP